MSSYNITTDNNSSATTTVIISDINGHVIDTFEYTETLTTDVQSLTLDTSLGSYTIRFDEATPYGTFGTGVDKGIGEDLPDEDFGDIYVTSVTPEKHIVLMSNYNDPSELLRVALEMEHTNSSARNCSACQELISIIEGRDGKPGPSTEDLPDEDF